METNLAAVDSNSMVMYLIYINVYYGDEMYKILGHYVSILF